MTTASGDPEPLMVKVEGLDELIAELKKIVKSLNTLRISARNG